MAGHMKKKAFLNTRTASGRLRVALQIGDSFECLAGLFIFCLFPVRKSLLDTFKAVKGAHTKFSLVL